jgi:hypothetical protein
MKFNTRTSCTKDEAVIMMLGLDKPTDLIGTDDQDTLYVKLDKTLEFMREKLVSDLTSEGQTQEYIAEFLDDFDKEFTKRARRYLIELDDELAKRSDSALRVLDDGQITLKSLYDWMGTQSSPVNTTKKTPKSENTMLITFATLLERFLEDKPKTGGFYRGKNINFAAVARHLEDLEIEGQGQENIKRLIENARKAKKEAKP